MTWVFGTEGGEENKRQIIGLVCHVPNTLASICSRTSERHAEPALRLMFAAPPGYSRRFWEAGANHWQGVGQRVSTDHQARARSVCSQWTRGLGGVRRA